ncbi:MAG TPA: hypothetical protein VJH65_02110 [Candidatus Nanoarchaeia archaeon]|nr:hypothetical protein [Candidatus Nanoarchaeia archaeon]
MFRRRGYDGDYNGNYVSRRRGANIFIFLVYIILGIYFINFPFNFLKIPDVVRQFDIWIAFVAGVFMLFGGINYFRVKRI